jgi:hypothetical protein
MSQGPLVTFCLATCLFYPRCGIATHEFMAHERSVRIRDKHSRNWSQDWAVKANTTNNLNNINGLALMVAGIPPARMWMAPGMGLFATGV